MLGRQVAEEGVVGDGGIGSQASPSRKPWAPRLHVRGLDPWAACRLVGWKATLTLRRLIDHATGYRSSRVRADRWRARWRRGYAGACADSLLPWSGRAGAAVLWLDPRHAAGWARESCTPADMEIADRAVAGVFDLLASGPVDVGRPPAWRRDLYSGHFWPLEPSHRIPLRRDDGSDIRTIWELSRCYHFIQLARAYWRTGHAGYRDAFVEHVRSWISDNPLGRGPHWKSPMDVAIRAANWTLGTILFAAADGIGASFWEEMLAHLVVTGSYLERYPEWHPVYRGNHYVANHVGLTYLGALFADSDFGTRWLERGGTVLAREMQYQVHADGTSFEASLGYHRLVTELFAYAGLVLRRNGTLGPELPAYEARLRGMYQFIETYVAPDGEAPLLGDADDGRLHAVSAESLRFPRRHRLGLPEDWWTDGRPASGAFAAGGFYVLRGGDDHVVVRCGPVGLRGAGSHDHNDQLSFELVLHGRRVVADSGTFTYTRNLADRQAFRSTAAHSVVQLGDDEQNPIRAAQPWRVLRDRARAECVGWETSDARLRFAGRHFGFAHRPSRAVCRREIERVGGVWTVADEVSGLGVELVTWRMHLAEGEVALVRSGDGRHEVRLAGEPPVRLSVHAPAALSLLLAKSYISPRYGERRRRTCLVLRGTVSLPVKIVATYEVQRESIGIHR